LTAASCQLLDRFLSDPTARGVGLAFVDSEQQLEEAFVPWCSVIGSAFSNNPSRSRSTGSIVPRKLIKQARQISAFDRWKSSDLLYTGSAIPSPRTGSNGNTVVNVFRRLSWSSTDSTPSRPMSSGNSSTGSLISNSTHSSECHTSSPSSFRDCNSEDLPCKPTYPRDSRRYLSCIESSRPREPSKISSFRELAILPTQRVTRYVLLFRGRESPWLSQHTSSLINCRQISLSTLQKPAAIVQLSRKRLQRQRESLKSAMVPKGILRSRGAIEDSPSSC
jgi:hypothetical protein